MEQYLFFQEYLIIFFPALLLGLLHTLSPCEDKSIFCFYTFGITKETRKSLFILILYGLGLMTANLTIAIITILISLVPLIIFPTFVADPFAIIFFGAFSSTFVAIGFLFFITRRDYEPHSKLRKQFSNLDWDKKRTPYLLGVLSGFPPCIFELFIYSQCLIFSLSYGFVEALLTVFYFSIGTFIGLFPLALAKESFEVQINDHKRRRIYIIMIMIIIIFNTIIMILAFLRIHIFPVHVK
ncbi:MAG: sulfite exporter TauE/SafE family protein [Promethearchaeota archaeon]